MIVPVFVTKMYFGSINTKTYKVQGVLIDLNVIK